jgi:hypothetical protein
MDMSRPSPRDADERRRRLGKRARAEYLAEAEEEHRRLTGRAMTKEEFERVLRRFPVTCPMDWGARPVTAHTAYSSDGASCPAR